MECYLALVQMLGAQHSVEESFLREIPEALKGSSEVAELKAAVKEMTSRQYGGESFEDAWRNAIQAVRSPLDVLTLVEFLSEAKKMFGKLRGGPDWNRLDRELKMSLLLARASTPVAGPRLGPPAQAGAPESAVRGTFWVVLGAAALLAVLACAAALRWRRRPAA